MNSIPRPIAVSAILMLIMSTSFSATSSSIDTLSGTSAQVSTTPRGSAQDNEIDATTKMVFDTVRTILRINDSLSRTLSIRKRSLVKQLDDIIPNDSEIKRRVEMHIDSIAHSDSIRKIEQSVELSRLRESMIGHPVMLAHDTLIMIYTKYGPFTAQERANAISNRILDVAQIVGFDPNTFSIFANESSHEIMYYDKTIMSITNKDALFFESTSDVLARRYLESIREGILRYRKSHSFVSYLLQIGQIIGILVLSIVVIFALRQVFHKTRKYVKRNRSRLMKGISIKTVSVLSKDKQYKATLTALRLVEIGSYLIIGYIALPFLFNVFPMTKQISSTIIDWTLSPIWSALSAIFHYLPNVFSIAVIIAISQILVTIFKKLFEEIEKGTIKFRGFYKDWARPTFSIIKFLVYVLMFVMIFPYLPGSDSPVFRGVSIFLGLLFSLGSTSAIANIVAGLVITYMRPFRIGDRIQIGEVTGDVLEKTMLITRLRTIKNEIVTMPNSIILTGHTVNYSINDSGVQLLLHTTVSIGYDVPWRTVHKLLIDAAMATDGISTSRNAEPFVLQNSLDDFYVSYELNAYTSFPQQMVSIYSLLHQSIQDRFNEAHVEILSPHYRSVRNGNNLTFSSMKVAKESENASS